jgi:diguanylate cyclase (GGDEF)-like protein
MLLFDGEEQVLGKNIRHLICGHDTEECILDQILSSKCRVEQNNFQHNGRYYHLVGTPLKDGEGSIQHMILLYTDVTERRTAAQEIERLAFFDSLTGLPNRVLLKDRLSQMLNRAERRSVLVAVLFIDLDHFKEVNDTLGHSSGDLLLQKVAERLTGSLRSCDTVARLGGDEFVVLLEDLNDRDAVTDVAVKLLTSLNEAVQLGERKVYTGGSIGVSLFPDDGSDVETLFKNADTAMYQAKALGRNRFCFYSEEMHESVMEQLTLSSSLRLACDRKEFYLVYQPQINLATGQLVGVEVLLRWEHPALGMIPTDRFIPVAEETGLMVPIGAWVLETACLQVMQWVRQGFPELRIAVNLSLQQFRDPGLVETIQAVLHCSGLPSHLLELELTEKVLVADITSSRATLQKLKALGITIAIDDFGIGYSSLSYLRHFPLDRLKIDMSFVQDIAEQSDDAAVIIDALIALAHGLNLSVIAERVEFTEQVLFLKQRLCDELQGYYISRPLPRETFEQVLKQCVQESDFCLFTCQ